MPIMFKFLFVTVALCISTVAAHAANGISSGLPDDAMINKFMVDSGLKTGLDKLPGLLFSQLFANVPASIPNTTKGMLAESYNAAYPEGSISTAVVKAIKTGKDAVIIPHLLEIVSLPVSRKMTALELKEPTQEEFQAYAMALSSKLPAKDRVELVKEVLDETHMPDVISKVALEAGKSIALAESSGCADDMKKISIEFKNNQPSTRQAIYGSALASMLFTYRTATDEELRDYVSTYRDPASKAIHLTIAKVVADEYLKRWKSFELTLQRVGRDLADISMFAKSCRKNEKSENAMKTSVASVSVHLAEASSVRNKASNDDARGCLDLNDNRLVIACAARYK